MSTTEMETPPPAEATAAETTAEPGSAARAPAEPTGLAGWLTTSDHKRVGRLYLVTALAFLAIGGAAGAILGVERIDSGLSVLGGGSFEQVYTLHGEVAVLLFLVPAFLGLATYLVPLQVGSPDIAFPRAAAAAYWTYLVSGGVLLAAYAADGGPGGGSAVAVDLYLLALLALNAATVLALVSILTTVVCLRAPGMTLERAPFLTWSALVGGGLTLLTAPVLMARLVELYVQHHFGGGVGSYGEISWFWAVPQVYVLVVPAVGVILEVVPVMAGSRLRERRAAMAVLVTTGVLGFGAFAQVEDAREDVLYVGMALAATLPALALLGLLADALRRGRGGRRAALLLAMGAAVHLALGALAGAGSALSFLDVRETVWQAAQVHFSLLGGAGLAALAALWFWAPKIWGAPLSDGAGKVAFVLVFWGTALLAVPDLVLGLFSDQPLLAATFDDDALVTAANAVSAAGGALVGLGVLVAAAALAAGIAGHRQRPVADDPWGGHTLEWATTSPPPAANFTGSLPVVTSATPLLDLGGGGGEPADRTPAGHPA